MAALREFVENGWPPQEVVGQAAAEAALLLVIHCPSLELQEHCRRLIGLSVQRGNSPAEHLQVLAMVLWLQQSCRQQEALAPDYGGAYESAGWGALQTTN
ncbi:hypothetical protein ACIQVO_37320 [Streptomyces sp. NPDC101062]|uniref:hypothetical protein n=1 Tax=unclassified Streptomyces TaxID=2593676 RepID=UPI00382D50B9